MKVAFIYGPFTLGGRYFDFNRLWESPRGLTGSEVSCLRFAAEFVKRGHDVHLFVQSPNAALWRGVVLHDLRDLLTLADSFQAVCSWNEPDMLRLIPNSAVRLVNQQLNDFAYCQPDFDQFVDVYTSPSTSHMQFIQQFTPIKEKWAVLPNGCDPTEYDRGISVPGRVIYASSPDRGLHLLLNAWPKIKKLCPNAHLKVFYDLHRWLAAFNDFEENCSSDFVEFGRRARYIKMAMSRMSGLDVQVVGSVSRTRIMNEMNEASTLAYPCDVVRYTEGFSVTTLEACASGTVPVISSMDSLGQIYGGIVPMVGSPARDHMDEFIELTVKAISDESFRRSVLEKTVLFAERHTWAILSADLEKILSDRIKKL